MCDAAGGEPIGAEGAGIGAGGGVCAKARDVNALAIRKASEASLVFKFFSKRGVPQMTACGQARLG